MIDIAVNIDNNSVIDVESEFDWNNTWAFVDNDILLAHFQYIIDKEAVVDYEVVAEYENGGKDVEAVIVEPERGHFDIVDDDFNPIEYSFDIPDYVPKTGEVFSEEINIQRWRRMSAEEVLKKKAEEREEEAKAESIREFINTGSDRLDTVEETQDDIVLLLADIVGGVE